METTRTQIATKNNVDPAFAEASASDVQLSVLYQQDGLCFLVRNKQTRQALLSGYLAADNWNKDPIAQVLDSFPEVPNTIHYGFHNAEFFLMPNEMLGDDVTSWSSTLLPGVANYTLNSSPLNAKFYATLDEKTLPLINSKGPQMQSIGVRLAEECFKQGGGQRLWVHAFPTELLIVAMDGRTLHVLASHSYDNLEGAMYHVANTVEQLGWGRDAVVVQFSGVDYAALQEKMAPYFKACIAPTVVQHVVLSTSMKSWDPVLFYPLLLL